MSAILMGRAFYIDLPMQLKFTLVALADHANDDGFGIRVGQGRLAAKIGRDERSLRVYLEELRTLGFITRLTRGSAFGRAKRPDTYQLHTEKLPTSEDIKARFATETSDDPEPEEHRKVSSENTGNQFPLFERTPEISDKNTGNFGPNTGNGFPTNHQLEPSVLEPKKKISAGSRRRTPTNPKKPTDERIPPILDYFCRKHRAALGADYPVQGGRDGRSLKTIPKTYDVAKITGLIDKFFALLASDQFLRERMGATIPNFVGKIPALLAQGQPVSVTQLRPTPSSLPDFEIPEHLRHRVRKLHGA